MFINNVFLVIIERKKTDRKNKRKSLQRIRADQWNAQREKWRK